MAKADKRARSMALYETILKLKDLDECCRFFDDLCTPTEVRRSMLDNGAGGVMQEVIRRSGLHERDGEPE